MKTVFIFGAGASKPSGAPLMVDFLDKARKLYEKREIKDSRAYDAFSDVFEAMAELRPVYDKSYLDLENIETLFGAIEMGVLINKFGQRKPAEIVKLRDSIIKLIVTTLELTVKFPVKYDQEIYPCAPYDEFVKMITEVTQKIKARNPTFSFITFNYDLGLDYALYHQDLQSRIPWDYCLSDNKSNIYPYLKLHGSINWGICRKCGEVIHQPFYGMGFPPNTTHMYWDIGTCISKREHCGQPLDGPLIVPPTWNKMNHQKNLINVWRRASEELGSANNIFVVGYSMPETDAFFRYLFALGTESKTRLERFYVFNPDFDGTVKERFERLIGVGIKGRFQFFNGDQGLIGSAISRMGNELKEFYS